MNVQLVFSNRDRHVLHALPAVLWLGACLYIALSLLQALPPGLDQHSPLSVRNIGVLGLCILIVYPVWRLGYLAISHRWPEASPVKRIAAMSLICLVLGAIVLIGALFALGDMSAVRLRDMRWYLLNLGIGIVLMPAFFFLIRGADTVREQITGYRTAPIRALLRKAGAEAGQKLIRLQSADHYIEVHTERGPRLVLMRLGDAVELLQGAPGGQVHRSHWVNFDEIEGVVRRNRKIWLRMSDGSEVPVSRSYRPALRAAGIL